MTFNNIKELGITQGRHIGKCSLSGVIIKVVLTVTERLMPWSSTARLMERRHGI